MTLHYTKKTLLHLLYMRVCVVRNNLNCDMENICVCEESKIYLWKYASHALLIQKYKCVR